MSPLVVRVRRVAPEVALWLVATLWLALAVVAVASSLSGVEDPLRSSWQEPAP